MLMQRICGIALGYEDLVDHDELRHDPVLATLVGKLEARRKDCAPLAGKSTLNRLEHAPAAALDRYHRIGHDPRGDRGPVRRPVPGGAREAARADHPRPRRHRRPLAWASGRALLPRLLRLLLLPAAVCVLRPPPAGGQAPACQHRRLGRRGRGDRPHRRPDPRALAQRRDLAAGGLRLCPRRAHGLVRGQRRRLRLRPRPQPAPAGRDRRSARRRRGRGLAQPARPADSTTSPMPPSTAGAANGGSSPRPSIWPRAPTRASS